ncbi:hypothetical protein PBRA_004793 [Plasmodiophora brassicae]|uniref:Amine oxidase domain-containing protein n=1 Tax=Plasmodiophora brassicae TaxID=37360 RepID=A0A0G4ILY1_PLABS|nr:hypothetical protein PBRA_004793 [Plasmodiophora brassicae]
MRRQRQSLSGAAKLCRPLDEIKAYCKESGLTVVVIGAGLAGVAAACELNGFDANVIVLEARDRVGGRVWTDRQFGTRGRGVDLGGAWIHGCDGNPITSMCINFGIDLSPTDEPEVSDLRAQLPLKRMPIFDWNGAPVAKHVDQNIEVLFNDTLTELTHEAVKLKAKGGDLADQSLGSALDERMEKLRLSDLESRVWKWHCSNLEYANATDLSNLSMLHWFEDDSYSFPGRHCLLKQGYQALVEKIASGLDVRLNQTVSRINYQGSRVKVMCDSGMSVEADMCIVTVPLGVLKSRRIRFIPELPRRKLCVIDKLGFGLLNKVVLQFKSVKFWTADSINCGYASKDAGKFYIFVNVEGATGTPTLVTLVSGSCAAAYEQCSDDEIQSQVLEVLRSMFGHGVPDPLRCVCTRWSQDPFAFGSYTYLPVDGDPNDIDLLAVSVADGRLRFAGEATSPHYLARYTT